MASMRKLSWVFAQLPGVKPRLASVAVKNGLIPGVMEDIHFMHGDLGPSMLVGPTAARLLHAAYQRGDLPMEAGTIPAASPSMAAYLADHVRTGAEADAHRHSRMGADPFGDWRTMEEAFRRAGHPVRDRLVVQGVVITRDAPGRQRDPRPDDIRFTWTDAKGVDWHLVRGCRPHPRD